MTTDPSSPSENRVTKTMWSVRARTRCVLEQATALPYWRQDYIQLSSGRFRGEIDSINTPNIQLFREAMNRSVDELASARKDSYVVGIPTGMDGDAYWGLNPIDNHSLITLAKNAELTFRTPPNSEIAAAVIDADRLEAYAETVMQIDVRDIFTRIRPVEPLPPMQARALRDMLYGSVCWTGDTPSSENGDAAWRHFEDDILALCVSALVSARPHTGKESGLRIHRYIVNRVRERVLASPLCPPSIGALWEELRISRRSLNHAFVRVLGIAPVSYMRNIRLNRVRAALLYDEPGNTTISDIALRWGFWHMSQFSRYYRELFGELPSETRRTQSSRADHHT